jgi:hypothetical protein
LPNTNESATVARVEKIYNLNKAWVRLHESYVLLALKQKGSFHKGRLRYEPFSVLPVTRHILVVSLAAAIPSHSVGQGPPQASACFSKLYNIKVLSQFCGHLTCTVFKYICRKYVFALDTLE